MWVIRDFSLLILLVGGLAAASASGHEPQQHDDDTSAPVDVFDALRSVDDSSAGWAAPIHYMLEDEPDEVVDDAAQEDDSTGQCPCPGNGGSAAKKPAKSDPCSTSHKGVFYANDFSYLNDPAYCGCCLGDCWKLMPVGECGQCGTLDVGGQVRMRYHHEVGMGQDVAGPGTLRFEDTQHDFWLTRLRLYTNWRPATHLRVYVEGIFADVTDDDGTYAPRIIDRNYGDFQNLFVDLGLSDELLFRVGRQELVYGAERLVSPLDWANTRRTFDGLKLIYQEGDWAVDGFYTFVVPVVPNELDEADYRQSFYGTYATYTGFGDDTVDLYYLGYDNENPGTITSDFSLHTLGARLNGEVAAGSDWLYELEGGVQFGRQSGLGVDHDAGFGTAGLGRRWPNRPWKPTVWVYYDYASGDAAGGDFNRFNQLFPLGHKYLGFIDAVQRSNIEAPNLLLTAKPHQKVDFLLWYWHFMANQAGDVVPSIGGTPTQSTSSKDLGDELDLIAKYAITPRSNILFGYSYFWRGNKILAPEDAEFFYTQWELNF